MSGDAISSSELLLSARLRFVRRERARDRRRQQGLSSAHAAFLASVCAALATDIEAVGFAHVAQQLPEGPTRDIANELVMLVAAGLAYDGIAATLNEVLHVASRACLQLEEEFEAWRVRTDAARQITQAITAALVSLDYAGTLGYVPAWLPKTMMREAVAHLHRRSR